MKDVTRLVDMGNSEIVVATTNEGKYKEFRSLLRSIFKDFYSLRDFGEVPKIVEDGKSFRENAYKKASAVARYTNLPVLADDSGLVVPSIGGKPGIYSARYAGEGATDLDNIKKLLKDMEHVSDRRAYFVCEIVVIFPRSSTTVEARGECEGEILTEPRGHGGFGYDPIFFIPDLGKTMAELDNEQKNSISHRAKAVFNLIEKLDSLRFKDFSPKNLS